MKRYKVRFSAVEINKQGDKVYHYKGSITFVHNNNMSIPAKAYLLASRDLLDCNYLEIEEVN